MDYEALIKNLRDLQRVLSEGKLTFSGGEINLTWASNVLGQAADVIKELDEGGDAFCDGACSMLGNMRICQALQSEDMRESTEQKWIAEVDTLCHFAGCRDYGDCVSRRYNSDEVERVLEMIERNN